MTHALRSLTVCVVTLVALVGSAYAEIQLTLKNSFIEKYKNRTSINDDCVFDHTKGKANSPSKDGDMHIAVRCRKSHCPSLQKS